MLEKGDLLTLSNEKEYILINQINMEGNDYLYLVSKDGISEVAICKIEQGCITAIKDIELMQKLIEQFKELE